MSLKKIIQIAVVLVVSSVLLYGLVYAPFQQKKLTEVNNDLLNKILVINNQAIKLSEIKDIKQCQLIATRQLEIANNAAQKDGKVLSKEEGEQMANNAYLNCLSVSGRDYIVNNLLQEQQEKQSQEENKNNQKSQSNEENSSPTSAE